MNNQGIHRPIRLPHWEELPAMGLYNEQILQFLNPYFAPIYDNDNVLQSTMINNYVKLGLVPAPERRRYCREALARLVVIVLLKSLFTVSEIAYLTDKMLSTHDIGESYNIFCEIIERTFGEVATGEIRRSEHEDEYIRILEDVGIAAACQLAVKRRFARRRKAKELLKAREERALALSEESEQEES